MKRYSAASVAICFGLLAGCASYIKDLPASAPHATLRFPESFGLLHAQTVVPLEINGIPSNGGRWDLRTFRLPPGQISLLLAVHVSPAVLGEAKVKFVGTPGENYVVVTRRDVERLIIEVKDSKGAVAASQEADLHVQEPRGETFVPIFIPAK